MPRRLRRRKSSISISSSSIDDSNNNNNNANNQLLPLIEQEESSIDSRKKLIYELNNQNFETWQSISLQIFLIIISLSLCLYAYFYFDHFHYHLTHFYAHHIDDHHAQHVLGHKLIKNRSHNQAFYWFRKSADNGHPHSAYNLAVGYLSGYRTDVTQGEVRKLLRFAAKNGVEEARELLHGLCREKPKYCDL